MQHLDEGTIHSWLDGALSAEEAARVEAHVAGCAECGAKVAEARGFIAGASRILTALDDVPSGVVPVAQPAAPAWRVNRNFLRAAAVVLVVATGGLLLMRGGGNISTSMPASATSTTESVSTVASQPVSKVAAVSPSPTTTAPVPTPTPTPTPTSAATPTTAQARAFPNPSAIKSVAPVTPLLRQRVVSAPSVVEYSGKRVSKSSPTVESGSRLFSPTTRASTVPSTAPSTAPMVATTVAPETVSGKPKVRSLDTTIDFVLQPDVNRLQAAVTTGVTGASEATSIPIKVVRVDLIPGGRRTTYEVAPGKLVYLSEFDKQQSIPVDYRARPSISWVGRKGKVRVLSGDFSMDELERIRWRIESQRK